MEAFMLLEYNGTHDYQENYLQNGYQMGFENSRWIIYSNETLNSFVLGHFYRCIRMNHWKVTPCLIRIILIFSVD